MGGRAGKRTVSVYVCKEYVWAMPAAYNIKSALVKLKLKTFRGIESVLGLNRFSILLVLQALSNSFEILCDFTEFFELCFRKKSVII